MPFLPLGFSIAKILELVGVDFKYAYVGIFLSAAAATFLWARIKEFPIIIFPELSIIAPIIYIDVISNGAPLETVLSSALLASVIGVVLSFFKFKPKFNILTAFFSSVELKFCFLVGVAFYLILEGLLEARILLPSPFYFAMIGDMENPASAVSLIGIIILIFLFAVKSKFAIIISTAMVILVSYVEGYIAIDEIFCFPDTIFNPKFIESFPRIDLTLKILFMLWLVGSLFQNIFNERRGIFPLFLGNIFAACFGMFMLLPSPLSAITLKITENETVETRKKISYFVSLFFVLFIFIEPLFNSLVSFSAIYVPSVIGAGIFALFLAKKLNVLAQNWNLSNILAAAAFIIIYPITQNIIVAIVVSFLIFVCCNIKFFK